MSLFIVRGRGLIQKYPCNLYILKQHEQCMHVCDLSPREGLNRFGCFSDQAYGVSRNSEKSGSLFFDIDFVGKQFRAIRGLEGLKPFQSPEQPLKTSGEAALENL